MNKIADFLFVDDGLSVHSLTRMTTGVGCDPFHIDAPDSSHVFKITLFRACIRQAFTDVPLL